MSHTNSNTQNSYSELRTVKGNTDVYSDSHNEPDTTDGMNCPDELKTKHSRQRCRHMEKMDSSVSSTLPTSDMKRFSFLAVS